MTLYYSEKKYIEKNMKLRQKSLSKIKKDIYKLKNNSVYGKTMENVRKYKDMYYVIFHNDVPDISFKNEIQDGRQSEILK